MSEIMQLLSAEISVPTVWMIAGAFLLMAAGGRSAWPAVAAALLLAVYYFVIFLGMR